MKKAYTLIPMFLITLSIIPPATILAKPMVSTGDILVYDIVSTETYYNVNQTSPYAAYFTNTTIWSRIELTIVSINETHIVLNSTLIDTNSTKDMESIGESRNTTIDITKPLSEYIGIIVDPSNIPENGVYENTSSGEVSSGPYTLYIRAEYCRDKGVLKKLHIKYTINVTMSGLENMRYVNEIHYSLIWTSIEDVELQEQLNTKTYSPPKITGNVTVREEGGGDVFYIVVIGFIVLILLVLVVLFRRMIYRK